MSDPLRVAMITEPTAWHRQKLIDALSTDAVGEVAVADATGATFDEVRDSAGHKLHATYTDLDQMYREFKPDAALITMEPWRMPAAIKQALEAGVHVYHEKPGFVDIEDYREIYRLARNRDLHLCIAYSSRMYPVVQEARRIVSEGLLGDLFSFQAHYIADQERIKQDPAVRFEYDHAAGGWFFSKEKAGGGHLTILGCHYLDLLRHISGSDFKSVVAMCKNVGGEPITVEDAAALTIEFDNGMIGNFNSGFYTSKAEYASQRHNGITIWGREGWLNFNPNGDSSGAPLQWSSHRGVHASAPLKTLTHDSTDSTTEVYRLLAQAFLRACQGEGPSPLAPEDGLWVAECTKAAYRAAETGRIQDVSIPAG